MEILRPQPPSKGFSYQRRFLIKDLFGPSAAMSKFKTIEFQSLKAFIESISTGLLDGREKQELVLPVFDTDQLERLLCFVANSKINREYYIVIRPVDIEAKHLARIFNKDLTENIFLQLDPVQVQLLTKTMKMHDGAPIHGFFLHGGSGLLYSYWHKRNYGHMYKATVEAAIANPFFQLIDLNFNYTSFEEMEMRELHNLYFHVNMFRNWFLPGQIQRDNNPFGVDVQAFGLEKKEEVCESDSCQCGGHSDSYQSEFRLKSFTSPLKCAVTDELKLYLDNRSLNPFFDMRKNIGKDGEEIPLEELDQIRQVLDVQFKEKIEIQSLINLGDNERIMKDIYMIPEITRMIIRWWEA